MTPAQKRNAADQAAVEKIEQALKALREAISEARNSGLRVGFDNDTVVDVRRWSKKKYPKALFCEFATGIKPQHKEPTK